MLRVLLPISRDYHSPVMRKRYSVGGDESPLADFLRLQNLVHAWKKLFIIRLDCIDDNDDEEVAYAQTGAQKQPACAQLANKTPLSKSIWQPRP